MEDATIEIEQKEISKIDKEKYLDYDLEVNTIEEENVEKFSPITMFRTHDLILTCEYYYFYVKKDLISFSAKSKNGEVSINISMVDKENTYSFISLNSAKSKVEGNSLKEARSVVRDIYQRYMEYIDAVEAKESFLEKCIKWCLGEPVAEIPTEEIPYMGDVLADEFIFGRKIIKVVKMEN